MKEIIIDVSEAGEVRIETRGFSGKSCLTLPLPHKYAAAHS